MGPSYDYIGFFEYGNLVMHFKAETQLLVLNFQDDKNFDIFFDIKYVKKNYLSDDFLLQNLTVSINQCYIKFAS